MYALCLPSVCPLFPLYLFSVILSQWGVKDFAGGIVVHITAGFSALAAVWIVGPRTPTREDEEFGKDTPHNIPFVALGTGEKTTY